MCSQGGVAGEVEFGICMICVVTYCAVGLVVMMGRCQRLDPSSILGRRICYENLIHKGVPLCHLGSVPDNVKLSITIFSYFSLSLLCTAIFLAWHFVSFLLCPRCLNLTVRCRYFCWPIHPRLRLHEAQRICELLIYFSQRTCNQAIRRETWEGTSYSMTEGLRRLLECTFPILHD
jgi:hypothetical protein